VRRPASMQRVATVATEPPRHLGDLLVSACAKHCAKITAGSDRGLDFLASPAKIEQQDFGAGKIRLEVLVATYNDPPQCFQLCHCRQ
jgi:hypothetical protein